MVKWLLRKISAILEVFEGFVFVVFFLAILWAVLNGLVHF